MSNLSDAADWVVKRISALTRTATDADLTDGEYMAVDKSDGYTRKMTVGSLATWVLGKIKNLATSITAFRTGDYIAVDGPSGTAKMSKDDLLRETAENAVSSGVAASSNAVSDIALTDIYTIILERKSSRAFGVSFICNSDKVVRLTVDNGYDVLVVDEDAGTLLERGNTVDVAIIKGKTYSYNVKKSDDSNINYDFSLQLQDISNAIGKIEAVKGSLSDVALGKVSLLGFKQGTYSDSANNRISKTFEVNRLSIIKLDILAANTSFILQEWDSDSSDFVNIGTWETSKSYQLNPNIYNVVLKHDAGNISKDEDVKLWLTDCSFIDVLKEDLLKTSLGKAQLLGFKQGTYSDTINSRISKIFDVFRESNIKLESLNPNVDFILQKWDSDSSDFVNIGTWETSHTYKLEPNLYNVVLRHKDLSNISKDEDVKLWLTDCGTPVKESYVNSVVSLAESADQKAQAALDATVTMLGNYDIICAASDTPTSLKKYAKYICDSTDARPDLQSAIEEAMTLGVKVKLLPGNYIINSRAIINNNAIACGLWFPNDKSNAEIYIKCNNVFHVFEGVIPPIGYNSGAHIQMGDDLYDDIGTNEFFSLFASVTGQMQGRGLCIKNLSISLPNNDKSIVIVNGQTSFLIDFENLFVSGCDVQSIDYTDNNTGDLPPVANSGCVGIRGVAGSNWGVQNIINNCEVQGCGVGFELGGEHGFFTNLSAKYNTYGFTFSDYSGKSSIGGDNSFGVMGYPLICLNLLDEHNVNLPKFGSVSGSTVGQQGITIENYNIQWPNTCPGHPDRTAPDFLTGRARATEETNGYWVGRIEYMIDAVQSGNHNPSMTPFFERGHGDNVLCTNIHMKIRGDSETRATYSPNLNQKYFDTTVNKMLIYDGTNWVDMLGNIVT